MDINLDDFQFATAGDTIFADIYDLDARKEEQALRHINKESSLRDVLMSEEWQNIRENKSEHEASIFWDEQLENYDKKLEDRFDQLGADEFQTMFQQGRVVKQIAIGQMYGINLQDNDTQEERNQKIQQIQEKVATLDSYSHLLYKGMELKDEEGLLEAFKETFQDQVTRVYNDIEEGESVGFDSEMFRRNVYRHHGTRENLRDDVLYQYLHRADEQEATEFNQKGKDFESILAKNLEKRGIDYDETARDMAEVWARKIMKTGNTDRKIEGVGEMTDGGLDFAELDNGQKLDAFENSDATFNTLKGKGLTAREMMDAINHGKAIRGSVLTNAVKNARADGEDYVGENDFEEFRNKWIAENDSRDQYKIVQAYEKLIRDNAEGNNGWAAQAGQFFEKNIWNPATRGLAGGGRSIYSGLTYANDYYFGNGKAAVEFMAHAAANAEDRDYRTGEFLNDVGGYGTVAALSRLTMNAAGQSAPFIAASLATGGAASVPTLFAGGAARIAGTQLGKKALETGVRVGAQRLIQGTGRAAFGNLSRGRTAALVNSSLEGMSIYGNAMSTSFNEFRAQGLSYDQAFEKASRTAVAPALVGMALTAMIGGIDGPGLGSLKQLSKNSNKTDALASISLRDLTAIAGGKQQLNKMLKETLDEDFVKTFQSTIYNSNSAIANGFNKGVAKDVLVAKAKNSAIEFAEEGIEEGLAGGLSDALANVIAVSEGAERDISFGSIVGAIVQEGLLGGAAGKIIMAPKAFNELKNTQEVAESVDLIKSTAQGLSGGTSNKEVAALSNLKRIADENEMTEVSAQISGKIKEAATKRYTGEAKSAGVVDSNFEADESITAEDIKAQTLNAAPTALATTEETREDDVKRGQHPVFGRGIFPRSQRNATATSIPQGSAKGSLIERAQGGKLRGKGALANHTIISSSKNSARVLARINTGIAKDKKNTGAASSKGQNTDRVIDITFDSKGNVANVSAPKALSPSDKAKLGESTVNALLTKEQAAQSQQRALPKDTQDFQDKFVRRNPPVNPASFTQLSAQARPIAKTLNDIYKRSTPLVQDGKVITKNPISADAGAKQIAELKESVSNDTNLTAQDKETLLDSIEEAETNLQLFREDSGNFFNDDTEAILARQAVDNAASSTETQEESTEEGTTSSVETQENASDTNTPTDSTPRSDNNASGEQQQAGKPANARPVKASSTSESQEVSGKTQDTTVNATEQTNAQDSNTGVEESGSDSKVSDKSLDDLQSYFEKNLLAKNDKLGVLGKTPASDARLTQFKNTGLLEEFYRSLIDGEVASQTQSRLLSVDLNGLRDLAIDEGLSPVVLIRDLRNRYDIPCLLYTSDSADD